MKKLLAAAALTAASFAGPAGAAACTLETCWFTQPVCSVVDCSPQLCWYHPEQGQQCIG